MTMARPVLELQPSDLLLLLDDCRAVDLLHTPPHLATAAVAVMIIEAVLAAPDCKPDVDVTVVGTTTTGPTDTIYFTGQIGKSTVRTNCGAMRDVLEATPGALGRVLDAVWVAAIYSAIPGSPAATVVALAVRVTHRLAAATAAFRTPISRARAQVLSCDIALRAGGAAAMPDAALSTLEAEALADLAASLASPDCLHEAHLLIIVRRAIPPALSNGNNNSPQRVAADEAQAAGDPRTVESSLLQSRVYSPTALAAARKGDAHAIRRARIYEPRALAVGVFSLSLVVPPRPIYDPLHEAVLLARCLPFDVDVVLPEDGRSEAAAHTVLAAVIRFYRVLICVEVDVHHPIYSAATWSTLARFALDRQLGVAGMVGMINLCTEQANLDQGRDPLGPLLSLVPNLKDALHARLLDIDGATLSVPLVAAIAFAAAASRTRDGREYIGAGFATLLSGIVSAGDTLRPTDLALHTALVLDICTAQLQQGKNHQSFVFNGLPLITGGKSGYMMAWPAQTRAIAARAVLSLIRAATSCGVNAFRFRVPPVLFTRLLNEADSDPTSKAALLERFIATALTVVKAAPEATIAMLRDGIDLVAYTLEFTRSNPKNTAVVEDLLTPAEDAEVAVTLAALCKLGNERLGTSQFLTVCASACRQLHAAYLPRHPAHTDRVPFLMRMVIASGSRAVIRDLHSVCTPAVLSDARFDPVIAHILGIGAAGDAVHRRSQTVKRIGALAGTVTTIARLLHAPDQRNAIVVATEQAVVFLCEILVEDQATAKGALSLIEATLSELEVLVVLQIDALPTGITTCDQTMATLALVCTRLVHFHASVDPLKHLLLSAFAIFASASTSTNLPVGGSIPSHAPSTAGVPHPPAASVHATSVDSLKGRHHHLQAYVDALPKNVALRARLIAAGYSPGFWGTRVFSKLEVAMVDGSAESLHIALVPLYQQLVPLLRESGIFEVGGTVVSEAMFSVDLSSEMLRTKRAAAVHALQARYAETELSDAAEECTAAVTTMLADEQRIENAWRVQQAEGKSKHKTKVLTVDVIHTLMDCARACAKVVGCYQPNGCHCEKPLEIGLRADMALISIRDQTGVELENCEVLCCDEALFVFKAYSTGHAWDTTALYISVFEQLLKNSSVPAIVVPEGFPKQSVFEALCERFPAAPHGTSLTAEYDFADGWKSYHDYRPTVCTVGVDLYLPGSSAPVWSHHTPAAAPLAPKIAQEPTVAVLLTDQAMCRLMASPNHSQFAFMGRDLARYIGDCIALDQAQRESAVDRFASKFDFERWCRRNAKARAKGAVGDQRLRCKAEVIKFVLDLVDDTVTEWVTSALTSPTTLLDTSARAFVHLLRLVRQPDWLEGVRGCVSREDGPTAVATSNVPLFTKATAEAGLVATVRLRLRIYPIAKLSRQKQFALMRWVFRNEDDVWLDRGGRDGCETVGQFIGYLGLGRDHGTQLPHLGDESMQSSSALRTTDSGTPDTAGLRPPAFPGVFATLAPNLMNFSPARDVLGYAVGECIMVNSNISLHGASDSTTAGAGRLGQAPAHADGADAGRQLEQLAYEVVTAWVHPGVRSCGVAMSLYAAIFAGVPQECSLVEADFIEGTRQRLGQASMLGWLCGHPSILGSVFIADHLPSYTSNGVDAVERFEKITFYRRPMVVAITTARWITDAAAWLHTGDAAATLATAALTLSVAAIVFRHRQR